MANYMTAQRKQLFAFLQENPDRQFSAKQIADSLSDSSVSLSAVYRNLTYLEEKGLINRFTKEGSRELFYQYIHSEDCRNCIHLNCIKCGRTFHMDAHIADRMLEDILKVDGFQIKKKRNPYFTGSAKTVSDVSIAFKKEEEIWQKKQKKLLAGFITLAILFMLLFSTFYITAEARHQCIGENCPICLEVQACVQALNTLGTGLAPAVAVFAAAYFFL